MKKVLLLTSVLLAMTASIALAANGNQLGWGQQCPFNSLSAADYADPCDGSGLTYLVTAVNAPAGLTAVTGEEIYIDMMVVGGTLPPFWNLGAGECGDGSIFMQALFSTFPKGTTATTCRDYWGTSASGGFHWYDNYNGPATARLAGVFARAQNTATLMISGGNYYTTNTLFTTTQADPLGANCAGCGLAACWVLNETILTQPVGVGDAILTASAGRNFVTWQGGANTNCPTSTPTKRTTWGEVKSLYR